MARNMKSSTCTAPVNIAVIKYWGKRDEELILPTNSSLSVTLGQDQLRAKTTVAIDPSFTEDRMWLNGKEQSMKSARLRNVLREIRNKVRKRKADDETLSWKVHICSENNFPTAAGLASSAAGYACLVFTLSKLFHVDGDISSIARQGSGSACRSVYGGFVKWVMGTQKDGADSIAVQVAPASHWPELRTLILVVSDQKKHTSSTEGMQTTVNTSQLFPRRLLGMEEKMEQMEKSINEKDFHSFAELTMKDSNQLHSVCLDTYPPISYMKDVSHQIVRMVHCLNSICERNIVAYTFDAGPNACLYLLEKDVPRVLSLVTTFFPPKDNNMEKFIQGLPVDVLPPSQGDLAAIPMEKQTDAIRYIIHTQVGADPQVLDNSETLLDSQGMPKYSIE
ncbi:hypothetical protein ScPMuIL_003141 [Solemya velum]